MLKQLSSKLFFSAFFLLGLFILPYRVFAAQNINATSETAYTLYTYTSDCSDPQKVLPGEDLKNNGTDKAVGIAIPNNMSNPNVTYLYFNGNDEPTISTMCKGSSYYGLCGAAATLGSPVIFPRVATERSSQKDRISADEFGCILAEAEEVLATQTTPIALASNFVVTGHSGGAFTMSSYFISGLTAEKALVFDGCYTAGQNNEFNFCKDILDNFTGFVDIYYQTNTEGTETESKIVYNQYSSRVTLRKVNLSHYLLPTACLEYPDTCEGHVVETSNPGTTESTASSATTKTSVTLSANSLPISTVTLINPIGSSASNLKGVTDIRVILGNVVQKALGLIGAVTLVVFIIGGAYWLLSAGNSERVKKGTETMVWAAIGLFVVFGAYGILTAVIGGLTGRPVVENTSVDTRGTEVQSGAYYRVGDAKISIYKEAKENQVVQSTIAATIPCVRSTGITQDAYIQIQDPANPDLIGWVLQSGLHVMTATEIKNAGCSN